MNTPDRYWERAGEVGYDRAMYASACIEINVRQRLWGVAVDIARDLGVPSSGRVLDLGCGDGAFTLGFLAPNFGSVDGYDKAAAAIKRASQASAYPHLKFIQADLVQMDYDTLPRYDAVFMIGFLHHVKAATPDIVSKVAKITDRVIVLEPNGNNLVRKALEFTPTYRSAGEDSFRTNEMKRIFEAAGFKTARHRRMNLFPNFTPTVLYNLLSPIEPAIERSNWLNALCTVNLFGFSK